MKKLLILPVAFFSISAYSQSIGINYKLLQQITLNQGVRVASDKTFQNSYEKQKKMYDEINKRIVKINGIHEYLYDKLRNVNETLLQGQQMIQIGRLSADIGNEAQIMMKLTARNPLYAPLAYAQYEYLTKDMIKLESDIRDVALKSDQRLLMDYYQRHKIISNVRLRLSIIYDRIVTINNYLQRARHMNYLSQVPVLNQWVTRDKAIVGVILEKYKIFKDY